MIRLIHVYVNMLTLQFAIGTKSMELFGLCLKEKARLFT